MGSQLKTELHPSVFNDIPVITNYGKVHLKTLACIDTISDKQIVINSWNKDYISDIYKALSIEKKHLEIIKGGDGMIYVTMPSLTQELRNNMLKQAAAKKEEYKINIRNIRNTIRN